MTEPLLSDEQPLVLFDECDNRGRWGNDDELGILNYITPEKRVAAARLVREGRCISLSLGMQTQPAPANRHMFEAGNQPVDHRRTRQRVSALAVRRLRTSGPAKRTKFAA